MIYLLLADGFEEIEALTPLDLLRRAGKTVKTVSITEEHAVCGAHGITVLADLTPSELTVPCDEMLILPGGMPGTKNLDASPVTDRLIRETVENAGYLSAICAAPMILGRRYLLNEKDATCYPGFEGELLGANVTDEPVVSDGSVITASGAGAALAFAAELVSCFKTASERDELLVSIREPNAVAEKNRRHGLTEEEYNLLRASRFALTTPKISTSLLQRRLQIGFGAAARTIDEMERRGYVSGPDGGHPRAVLLTLEQFLKDFDASPVDRDE